MARDPGHLPTSRRAHCCAKALAIGQRGVRWYQETPRRKRDQWLAFDLVTGTAPAGVELLTCLNRLELRFDSAASLVASDAHDDPATLE